MTSNPPLVRPYAPGDRAAVRRIACDTADRGRPMESFFSDRELLADLITRYYTDFEPGSAWVAEAGGETAGYLTGCLAPERHGRIMAARVVPPAILRALGRGLLFRRDAWRMVRAGLANWRGGTFRRDHLEEEYPAHFHINLLPAARGLGLGRQLVERFEEQVRRKGLPGFSGAVRGDHPSIMFFLQRLGFREAARFPSVMPEGRGLAHCDIVIWGKRVGA